MKISRILYSVSLAIGAVLLFLFPSHSFAFAPSTSDITGFSIVNGTTTISGTNITVAVPFGTDVTALVPTITINGVSVAPLSGVAQNFTTPVMYVVSAANETTQTYTVTVVPALSPAKSITLFSVGGRDASINDGASTINSVIPFRYNLAALSPTITITGSSISPATGTPQDFTNPVPYTVTAADGSTKTYTVTVQKSAQIPAPVITPVSGNYSSAQTVTIVSNYDGKSVIYYTLDGSDPRESETRFNYEGSFVVNGSNGETKTVKAYVYAYDDFSDVTVATYTFGQVTSMSVGGSYFVYLPPQTPAPTPSAVSVPQPTPSAPSTQGKVLGATASCKESGPYLTQYARIGYKNDVETVKKLQQFLNSELGLTIPVTGFFGVQTEAALKKYQLAHKDTLLTPWNITEPTGILYITTLAAINHSICADFAIASSSDVLIPFNENPKSPKKN